MFAASTKQVNQFFRRFNGEESPDGTRYLPGDSKYRDMRVRKNYLPLLIDPSVYEGQPALIREFADRVINKKQPVYLDYHGGDWMSEVNCHFSWQGQSTGITLLMKLQPQGEGYEWVIDDVSSPALAGYFDKSTGPDKPFIHPMSHELDFMNLKKAFKPGVNPESFTPDDYVPDLLTVFLFELKTGRLVFESVQSVRFHFFSVPGWYFELSEYNRPGMPSGWLISNLVKANDGQKSQLRDYLYGR